jgi:uncharacterized protein YqgC (DUF456 family)
MDYFVWALTIVLMLTGLVGTFIPLLPGTLLILAAALLHKLLLPGGISWMMIAWLAALWLVSLAADIGGTLLGTRLFGGTRWGMAGASGGAVVGMFFSLPAIVLGSILGAVAAEKLGARRSSREALRAGAGAAVGFILSAGARLTCAAAMIAVFFVSAVAR